MKQFLLGFFLSLSVALFAQDGTFDPTFGDNGITITDITGDYDLSTLVAENIDGSLWTLGIADYFGGTTTQNILVRYNSSGTFDTSFGVDGVVALPTAGQCSSLIPLPDGSMLVAGIENSNFFILKYNSDGSQDLSFGTNGVGTVNVNTNSNNTVFIESNGNITIAGSYRAPDEEGVFVARLLENGSLDSSFGVGGINTTVITTKNSVMGSPASRYPDGTYLIPFVTYDSSKNSTFMMAKLTANGSLDLSFGNNGITLSTYNTSDYFLLAVATIQSDGRVLALLHDQGTNPPLDSTTFFIRFSTNGTLDTAYGTRPIPYNFLPKQILPQANNRLLILGSEWTIDGGGYTLIRTYASGFIDSTFAQNGRFFDDYWDAGQIQIVSDGSIFGCVSMPPFSSPRDFIVFKLNNNPLSVSETNVQEFTATPNPSTGIFTLFCSQCELTNQKYTIVNMLGKVVKQGTFTNSNYAVNLTGCGSGIYFLKIGSSTLKLLKK